jgi:hypothetical protein
MNYSRSPMSISIGDCPIVSEVERKALNKAKKQSLKEAAKKKSGTSIRMNEYRQEVETEEELKMRMAEIVAQSVEKQKKRSTVTEESSEDTFVLVDVDPFTVFDVKISNE